MGDSLNKLHKWGRKDIRRLRRYGNCETNPTDIRVPGVHLWFHTKITKRTQARIWRFLYSSVVRKGGAWRNSGYGFCETNPSLGAQFGVSGSKL
jgi:hypothetical protein